MKRLIALALALTIGGAAVAQMGPPAKQLKVYEPMLGNWEGSGGGNSAPGVPMKWTSKSTMKKILGGHYIQDDTKIEVEGFGTLVMRSIYGWDANRKRHFAINVSNLGSAGESTVFWVDGKRMISSHTKRGFQGVESDRWVTEVGENKISFVGTQSLNGDKPFVHVEGTITRGGDGFDADTFKADAAAPPSPHMKRMKPFTGSWTSEGRWMNTETETWTKMSGSSTVVPAFGGHVIYSRGKSTMEGMPTPVEGYAYGFWSDEHQAYRWVGVNSMGMYHGSTGYEAGEGRTVWMMNDMFMGKPVVGRLVIEEHGDSLTMVEHSMGPKGAAHVSWEGKMTRVKG